MRRLSRRALIVLAVALPFALGAFLQQSPRVVRAATLFDDVFRLVQTSALDSLPTDALYERAARGLIAGLNDPYAAILSPEELASFSRNSLGNRYAGTGMTIRAMNGRVMVYRVTDGGPADFAGMRAGDQLLAVDGTRVVGLAADSVSKLLLGVPNTTVRLAYERPGRSDSATVEFKRDVVRVPAVPFTLLLEGNVGYVPIQRFNDVAAADLANALLTLQRQGATRFVLDLRGNGGGDLYQSLQMVGLFLTPGQELARVQHRGKRPEIYRASQDPVVPDAPIAVLIDGRSASASEIVAGSLQDHDRALIVGTRSFGKGVVQTQTTLASGWAVRLTTGKWYTPSGRSIQAEHAALQDGRFVERGADSTARPTFRSDAGRTVLGGGGVTPDLEVRPDTASTAERDFARALGNQVVALQDAAFEVARLPGLSTPEARREALWTRLEGAKVAVTRAQFDAAREVIDRLVESQVLGLTLGDSAAVRRQVATDVQLQTAVAKLRGVRDTKELLGL
ncbi:MAG TPA: S41 family peptidase [Gemmatimonadales bacterium]|nr:S41 family peptidase [Gemmatimonadales bacterium]